MKINLLPFAIMLTFLLFSCQQNSPKTAASAPTTATSETLPWASNLDLVCEMSIKQTVDDTLHYDGKIYGFCSTNCKEKFQENPAKYSVK